MHPIVASINRNLTRLHNKSLTRIYRTSRAILRWSTIVAIETGIIKILFLCRIPILMKIVCVLISAIPVWVISVIMSTLIIRVVWIDILHLPEPWKDELAAEVEAFSQKSEVEIVQTKS